jgi:hypothetical protein
MSKISYVAQTVPATDRLGRAGKSLSHDILDVNMADVPQIIFDADNGSGQYQAFYFDPNLSAPVLISSLRRCYGSQNNPINIGTSRPAPLMYAIVQSKPLATSHGNLGVFKSTDFGNTWTFTAQQLTASHYQPPFVAWYLSEDQSTIHFVFGSNTPANVTSFVDYDIATDSFGAIFGGNFSPAASTILIGCFSQRTATTQSLLYTDNTPNSLYVREYDMVAQMWGSPTLVVSDTTPSEGLSFPCCGVVDSDSNFHLAIRFPSALTTDLTNGEGLGGSMTVLTKFPVGGGAVTCLFGPPVSGGPGPRVITLTFSNPSAVLTFIWDSPTDETTLTSTFNAAILTNTNINAIVTLGIGIQGDNTPPGENDIWPTAQPLAHNSSSWFFPLLPDDSYIDAIFPLDNAIVLTGTILIEPVTGDVLIAGISPIIASTNWRGSIASVLRVTATSSFQTLTVDTGVDDSNPQGVLYHQTAITYFDGKLQAIWIRSLENFDLTRSYIIAASTFEMGSWSTATPLYSLSNAALGPGFLALSAPVGDFTPPPTPPGPAVIYVNTAPENGGPNPILLPNPAIHCANNGQRMNCIEVPNGWLVQQAHKCLMIPQSQL